jgi:hypothetical protein
MAAFAYYADLQDGTVLEWKDTTEHTGDVDLFGNPRRRTISAKVGHREDGKLAGYHPQHGWTRITRTVRLKSSPSRHVCDVRCINAKGRAMECECACGGKNHGRGAFLRCVA